MCVGAVPSFLQYQVAEAAASYGKCDYFDLGASNECLIRQKALDEKFKKNGKILMPFCGFDPGMLNILLLSCARHINCDEIKVYVGGITKEKPENSFVHEWTFNPESTLETYRGNVFAIQNGVLVTKQALDGYVNTFIGLRSYDTFFTNCGNEEVMRKISETLPRIKTCEIRTVRYYGHWHIVNFLSEKGLLDNEAFPITAKRLAKTIPFAEEDTTILEIRLFKNGHRVGCVEWTEHGDQKTTAAMQKATATSAALIISLALEYASHTPISGFMMPEFFTSETLKLTPEKIIDSMKAANLSITASLPS